MSELLFLLLLAVFMSIGALVNRVLKRPSVNGASIFLVVAGALILVKFLTVFRTPDAAPEAAGGVLGEHLFSVLCGAYFAHRFAKQHRVTETGSAEGGGALNDSEEIEQCAKTEMEHVAELPQISDEELERQALAGSTGPSSVSNVTNNA